MQFGAASLLPPLVAIVLAIVTRRVILPLAAGVFVGAVILAGAVDDARWWQSLAIFWVSLKTSVFSLSHLQALAFSLLLGAMVGVLEGGGGMRALIERFSRRVRDRRDAQTMIAASGLAIFFDDYANTLLVGGTMRTTADRYRISREKLAYLVDSTAAPVAGLSVVSTWAAIEISYMAEGLQAGGVHDGSAAFEMFIASIPYRFYPWLALVLVFAVAISGRDFGAMRRAEQSTIDGDAAPPSDSSLGDGLLAGTAAELDATAPNTVIADAATADRRRSQLWIAAVVPVLVCLWAVAAVIVWTGGLAARPDRIQPGPLSLTGEILGNGDSYLALIAGGGLGLIVAIALHLLLGGCDAWVAGRAALRGAGQMLPAMLILWFAWALSDMTDTANLDTGGYLASVLTDRLDARLLPTVVFLLAGAIAFSTGTSWGTMAILTPLSISLGLSLDPSGGVAGPIVLTTCGSVLAGAIFGDHCSPISDTTVLSSRASGCDHVAHVRTQMPYALVVAVICVATGTVPAALGLSPWWCLALGTAAVLAWVRCVGARPQAAAASPTKSI